MQKLRNWIMSHIEAVIAAVVTAIFGGIIGWWKGFRDGSRRKEKELIKTKEALRKLQAEYDLLDAKDRKSRRDKKKLEKQIGAYQSRIVQLEEELAQR